MATATSPKKATLKLLEQLDDDVTFEDIMHELHVLQKIERGLQDAENDRVTPHEDGKIGWANG
jgi:predicted transcriptional regulator